MEKLRKEREDRERLAAEQARIAREEEEERQRLEKQRQEEEKMARIQAGLPAEPEPETVGEEGIEGEEKVEAEETVEMKVGEEQEQEKVEEEEEFHSDVSVEDEEYIPPGGLFIPGLYSPPNELAKANGLVFFYPKLVSQLATIESEHLPPHVLVMFNIDKRHEVREIMEQYPNDILHVGIFVGEDPLSVEHIAFTIKQYDKMTRLRKHKDRLALMVSRRRSLALLQLAGLNPCYISSDVTSGEKDCLALFPVGYADDYEEEESVIEEEIPEVVTEAEVAVEQEEPEEPKDKEDEDEEED